MDLEALTVDVRSNLEQMGTLQSVWCWENHAGDAELESAFVPQDANVPPTTFSQEMPSHLQPAFTDTSHSWKNMTSKYLSFQGKNSM